jgi:hypothetical protein
MIELPEPGTCAIRTLPSNNTIKVIRDRDSSGFYVQYVISRPDGHPHKVQYWDDLDPINVWVVLRRIEQREGAVGYTVLRHRD